MEELSIFEIVATEAGSMGWIDWVVTITALIYVVLASRGNAWCWMWGIISCSLWAYASFTFYQLYLDALLQVFYVGMGFLGIYQWQYRKEQKTLDVTTMNLQGHAILGGMGVGVALVFGYIFGEYTAAAATYLDALTTVFSIIATFLLVRKVIENWIYWVIIDTAYVYLYSSRGAYLFALLMIIYVIIAISGYFHWKRLHAISLLESIKFNRKS